MSKFRENWESEVLEKMTDSVDSVKKELSPLLEAKLKSQSVVDNSISQIDNSQVEDTSQSQSNEKVKVRSIGARSDSSIKPSVSTVSNEPVKPIVSEGFEDVDTSLWRGGFSGALILIATAVLVLLVFAVSYFAFNQFM